MTTVSEPAPIPTPAPVAVRVSVRDGVRRIVMDRPPLNVLDIPMMAEMRDAFVAAAQDAETRVVLLTGQGKAFCAGVDVADHTEDRVEAMIHAFHGALSALMAIPAPVVMAVNGHALGGGCELLLCADIAIAHEKAKLGQPEIKLGVFPPAAVALLPRLIGRQRALDLALSGRVFSSAEAVEMGLVMKVVPADDFGTEVDRYVGELAGLSGPVLRLTKRVLLDGLDQSPKQALEMAEEVYLSELMDIGDAHEGLQAFMEKREPVWKGA
jgi:cyclohexa-1,5-dienecarbonyl-CoA hydratase